jgi:hypothetical protein
LGFLNGEPLHTPRARVRMRHGSSACKVSFRSKPHLIRAPGHMHSMQTGPSLRHHWCVAIAKASHLSRRWLGVSCSMFGTGEWLCMMSRQGCRQLLSCCEARKGLAKSAFGAKDTRINTFPAWKLRHHFVELVSCRRFGRIGQGETP